MGYFSEQVVLSFTSRTKIYSTFSGFAFFPDSRIMCQRNLWQLYVMLKSLLDILCNTIEEALPGCFQYNA